MTEETKTEEPRSLNQFRNNRPPVFVPILVIILIFVGVFVCLNITKEDKNFANDVKKSRYQAVFLTNGQVYFGKIKEQRKDAIKLEDIYYLQVQQDVQPAKEESDQQLSLAKLGKELHGPEDVMIISSDQVLFWENLKNDSQVVKAIKDAK